MRRVRRDNLLWGVSFILVLALAGMVTAGLMYLTAGETVAVSMAAIASAAAIVSSVGVWATVRESVHDRRERYRPYVVVKLHKRKGDVHFVVSNIGMTAATNITIEFDPDPGSLHSAIWTASRGLTPGTIDYLGPGSEVADRFAMLDMYNTFPDAPFTVTVAYEGEDKAAYNHSYTWNLKILHYLR